MKAIITTKGNNTIVGKLCMFGDYIITLDVNKLNLGIQALTAFYDEGISASDYNDHWHITVARKKVESIEFVD